MQRSTSLSRRATVALLAVVWVATSLPAAALPPASELKPATVAAFDNYARQLEARHDVDLSAGAPFLWVDTLPEAARKANSDKLARGEVVMQQLARPDCPDGIIHHWIGTIFIPGITLPQLLKLLQDYDHHSTYYSPEVTASKLHARNGGEFKIFLRFRRKKVITVVLNTNHTVRYTTLSPTRAASRSVSTRVAQAEDADRPDGPEKPVGNDGGYLWRINAYWRFEQKDGGVYVQCESISLSRTIPAVVRWFVAPIVDGITRESLAFTLTATRRSLLGRS
jgi:hypothetical protein